MSATDVLRRLLDERGVEHYDHENGEPLRDLSEAGPDPATSWRMGDASVCAVPNNKGTFDLWIDHCTPEQAIAATLGHYNAGRYVGLRQGEYWERTENSDYYCGGCGWKVTDHDSYCPECGGALHEYALGAGTCHVECFDDGIDEGLDGEPVFTPPTWYLSCGHTEQGSERPNFCPVCGRAVVA